MIVKQILSGSNSIQIGAVSNPEALDEFYKFYSRTSKL